MKIFLKRANLKITNLILIIEDEWFPISLSYTSGTTGNPKGVVTHHRGAYLNSISNHLIWHMKKKSSLSLDFAYVSLQWLVLSLDDRSFIRN